MPFNILFRVLFHLWAWKLAAASAVAEVLLVKAGLDLALQACLALAVVVYQATCTGVLEFFAAYAVDSAWGK